MSKQSNHTVWYAWAVAVCSLVVFVLLVAGIAQLHVFNQCQGSNPKIIRNTMTGSKIQCNSVP